MQKVIFADLLCASESVAFAPPLLEYIAFPAVSSASNRKNTGGKTQSARPHYTDSILDSRVS